MKRIITIVHEKPLVLIPSGSHVPLVGVTKSETDKLTGIITFYLGENRSHKCIGGYTLLGTYENGEIIYNKIK
jgi:hypothetical protein